MSSTAEHPPADLLCDRECFDVLLIDDDEFVRSMMVAALQRSGYTLRWAPEGRTAQQLLRQHRFRLVITDIFMPEMDGIEVIMRNANHSPQTPILAISGGGNHMGGCQLRSAKALGCTKTLAKPFELPEFLAIVAELIGPK